MAVLEDGDLVADCHRLAVAFEADLRGIALRTETLGGAGLLEHRPLLGQVSIRRRALLARADERVTVALELLEGELAGLDRRLRLRDGVLRDLETARVLGPSRIQVGEGTLQLPSRPGRAAVGAADRRLEPIAEGSVLTREVVHLVVPHRRRRSVERLGRNPGQRRELFVRERGIRRLRAIEVEPDIALRPAKRLLEMTLVDPLLVLLLEVDRNDRPRIVGRVPRPERFEVRGAARALA